MLLSSSVFLSLFSWTGLTLELKIWMHVYRQDVHEQNSLLCHVSSSLSWWRWFLCANGQMALSFPHLLLLLSFLLLPPFYALYRIGFYAFTKAHFSLSRLTTSKGRAWPELQFRHTLKRWFPIALSPPISYMYTFPQRRVALTRGLFPLCRRSTPDDWKSPRRKKLTGCAESL